ncbi:hypothetical protein COEREDRAFT_45399 [Coemansia reversa NRRL 1564]|uniref:Autophagy-related protein 2 n=1 Tax=Coemansia reversa (strain ATCC 12441 / NRRL 1564) TaxID=763665 RepID=A0A2G5B7Z6_COERN|nr:hypothetical protein COEREDRAFT_45399 [Coemansia reversa NRRL 1564]|eukprot:PIA15156.1 hypothetical protein COEREDRAFT_45399 [Coemansia reversa NRRL 1564]
MPEHRAPFDYYNSSSGPSLSSRAPLHPPRSTRRSTKPQVELCAVHVHSEYKQYAESSGTAFDLGLNVDLLEIIDELETSEWSKFLTRRRDAKTGLPASLQSLATALRPFASQPATVELRADVEISPLRCYIHQDALDFLIAGAANDNAAGSEQTAGGRKTSPQRTSAQPYFQIIRIAPINVIFDYKPRRMRALSSGSGPVELLNFFPLEDAEMTLISVKKRGVAGISKLVQALGHMWLPHLTQTQIPGVVSGVTPLRSLVNIGSGVADLVILPLEHYRKDGRLMQGIRRGAKSFAKTTALEAIQLGAKVAINAQTLLEQAGDILNVDVASSGDSGSAPHSHESRRDGIHTGGGSDYGGSTGTSAPATTRRGVFNKSKYAKQPENLSEGMRQAYASLRNNVSDAVETILAIPLVVQEDDNDNGEVTGEGAAGRSPVHGSLRAVVHAVPIAVFKPMIGATEAVSKTLLGLRNTMEPERRGQLEDKYKSRGSRAKNN